MLLIWTFIASAAFSAQRIHPRNKILMKTHPRPFKMRFPEVPRITAVEALGLYMSGQAFFIRIGDEGGAVPGCLLLRENTASKLNVNKLFKKIFKKYVVLYCH
jgi:hypothetical protein